MFRLLGPVELRVLGGALDLGSLKQRTVLAVLLLDQGRLVTTQALIERVWDASPPADVKNSLYTYVARLRRILKEASARSGLPIELQRQHGGYRLRVDPAQIDLTQFRRMTSEAQARDQQTDAERAATLEAALTLWDGSY